MASGICFRQRALAGDDCGSKRAVEPQTQRVQGCAPNSLSVGCCECRLEARPSFSKLSPAQQHRFGGGIGPRWMSRGKRRWITETASWYFREADWRHHYFGYVVGGDRWDRARCDGRFLGAMLRDAIAQKTEWPIAPQAEWFIKAVAAIITSMVFYAAVRIGGQFGSFVYRERYASLEEVFGVSR